MEQTKRIGLFLVPVVAGLLGLWWYQAQRTGGQIGEDPVVQSGEVAPGTGSSGQTADMSPTTPDTVIAPEPEVQAPQMEQTGVAAPAGELDNAATEASEPVVAAVPSQIAETTMTESATTTMPDPSTAPDFGGAEQQPDVDEKPVIATLSQSGETSTAEEAVPEPEGDSAQTFAAGTATSDMPDTTDLDPSQSARVPNSDTRLAGTDEPATSAVTAQDREPEASQVADDATPVTAAQFDLVRVESDGSTVIAGRAEPGAEVTVTADGQPIGTATASDRGEFVAMVDTPRTGFAQELRLRTGSDGDEVTSDEAVIIIVDAPDEAESTPEAPVVVISSPTQVEVVQPALSQPVGQIVLDTISYSAEGAVILSGRGTPASTARIYANDAPIAEADIRADGTWTVVVEALPIGNYTLRVDEVADDGRVTSRAQSPFRRVEPAFAIATVDQADPLEQIVVQPGNNLWTIARERYGKGPLFTQIFTANSDQIRDPDLIYPGQIFSLPDE
ncbi:Ig-like domain-containing protein [Pontivivens nitratireducens]|uniref:LysM peptidoglycan-binding domain-containing protein n=1 Tax=Pontivivens nitratireducens TaxID=2758038 RepID=A0A6G7VMC1_9RHOB|nr:Ig-like domain-containing protein [Pontibrevibacter nitratireducens]QIK41005.1 LysM peptidoglycan-binding domain-containing protein [Pontibrevibacter nitratireducens]